MRSVQKVSCDVIWKRHLLKKVQETLCIGQWHLSPLQSRHLGTSHGSPNCHQLPCRIFLNFINGLKSLSFQRRFYFWGKPEVAGCQIWAVGVLSHLGDLVFHKKKTQHVMLAQAHCCEEAASHQLPVAVAVWIVSVEECSILMQNLMEIHCSTQSFWMQWPHSAHAYSMASTAPTD